MSKPSCFVTQIDPHLAPKIKSDLEAKGFSLTTPPYTLFQAKGKGVSCTLYESGKLVVQGKDKDEFIQYYLEVEVLGNLSYSHPELSLDTSPRIGVDEAGKGDVFGPLSVCALYSDEAGIKQLVDWGVKDSKRMNDQTILALSKKIRGSFRYSSIALFPQKYNELYAKFNNLNRMLAWGHATAIAELSEEVGCKEVIIDQFAGEHVVENALSYKKVDVNLTQRHRGEEDIVVAAASIVARAIFVEGMDKLSKAYGIELPKGASAAVVQAGRAFVLRHGKENLPMVGKMHFKTIQSMI